MTNHYILLLVLFLFTACSSTEKESQPNSSEQKNVSVNEDSSKTLAPENTIISDYFNLFLPEFFDYTTEGIGQEELSTLLKERESEYWIIKEQSEASVIFKCKIPSSSVTILFYLDQELNPVFQVLTQNEQASTLKIYSTVNEKLEENKELLAIPELSDFYKEENFPGVDITHAPAFIYYLSNNFNVCIDLNYGMSSENVIDPDYVIEYIWNGNTFTTQKKDHETSF